MTATTPSPPKGAEGAKKTARRAVEGARADLVGLSRAIYEHPELCFGEVRAAELVGDALERAGLTVERGVAGLPTALAARVGSGPLSLVVCAEYDALPDVGHACGHNLIAASAVGAAVGLAQVADDIGLSLTVLGTPAEEGGGGKVLMLEAGAFAGAHAAMMVHPWPEDRLQATCLAVDHLEVRFTGREAHASASPEKGVNAADALVIAQVAIGLLRQHLNPGDQVHGIVTKGGEAANIVPKEATGRFMTRARTLDDLAVLRPRIDRCFEAGALATGAALDIRTLSPTYSQFEAYQPLLTAWRRNAEALGRRYDEDDAGKAAPTISTDMANVSLAVPSIHPMIGLDSRGAVNHQAEFAAACVGPSAEQALLDGALSMAWTAIDAASDAGLREQLISRAA
ncbi:MAG TPA: M20 family metallopeptidase [Acidimicrobiales bacterium]|nr:M20 family metallopeptidase [Acidimicrobiales bacterium]